MKRDKLHYRGYSGELQYNLFSGYFGEVEGIHDLIIFGGETLEEAEEDFKNSIDEYYELKEATLQDPDKPFKSRR